MSYFSGVLFRVEPYIVTPATAIRMRGSNLLLEIGEFKITAGGAFEKTVRQEHVLAKR
jgi:hypothetical protein